MQNIQHQHPGTLISKSMQVFLSCWKFFSGYCHIVVILFLHNSMGPLSCSYTSLSLGCDNPQNELILYSHPNQTNILSPALLPLPYLDPGDRLCSENSTAMMMTSKTFLATSKPSKQIPVKQQSALFTLLSQTFAPSPHKSSLLGPKCTLLTPHLVFPPSKPQPNLYRKALASSLKQTCKGWEVLYKAKEHHALSQCYPFLRKSANDNLESQSPSNSNLKQSGSLASIITSMMDQWGYTYMMTGWLDNNCKFVYGTYA